MENYGKDLLSPSEIAKILNVSYRTVMFWIQQNKMSSFKLGRHVRVERNELNKWIQQCQKED